MSAPATTETKPAPTPVEKIKVKVDGREIEVPRTTPDPLTGKPIATTMIQACAALKVDVPHYCYHPRLPVAVSRVCQHFEADVRQLKKATDLFYRFGKKAQHAAPAAGVKLRRQFARKHLGPANATGRYAEY